MLKATDPRRWTRVDWASDLVPHLVYGFATAATLVSTDGGER